MFLLLLTIFVLALVQLNHAACDPEFPNATDGKLHWYSCADENAKLRVDSIQVFDGNGSSMYPLDVGRGLMVNLQAENISPNTYKMIYMDATLKYWGRLFGWGECKWRNIPTFGMTTNMDGCDLAKNCPFGPGPTAFKQRLDFGAFSSIIGMLGSDTVYEIEMRAKDGDNAERELLTCIRVQALMA